jgi:TonB family protein
LAKGCIKEKETIPAGQSSIPITYANLQISWYMQPDRIFGNNGLAALLFHNDLSKNLWYNVKRRYERAVKKETLSDANVLADIIEGYPVNWIEDYISVEIVATVDGKIIHEVGADDSLNMEQKNLLKEADLATGVVVTVKYNYKNTLINYIEPREMQVKMAVVPEIEAEYAGGYKPMIQYLKENSLPTLLETTSQKFEPVMVLFTINEEGKITNVKLSNSSGNPKIDTLYIETITKMPNWKPAKDAKGNKVKQDFEFSVGLGGC